MPFEIEPTPVIEPPKPSVWKLAWFYLQTLVIMLGLSAMVWRDPQTQWDKWGLQMIVVLCVYNFNYKNVHP